MSGSVICVRNSAIPWPISKIQTPTWRTRQGDSNILDCNSNPLTEKSEKPHKKLIEGRYITLSEANRGQANVYGTPGFSLGVFELQLGLLDLSWKSVQDSFGIFEIDREMVEIRRQTPVTSVYAQNFPKIERARKWTFRPCMSRRVWLTCSQLCFPKRHGCRRIWSRSSVGKIGDCTVLICWIIFSRCTWTPPCLLYHFVIITINFSFCEYSKSSQFIWDMVTGTICRCSGDSAPFPG